jgi:glyoxylase-like metal-dependent hydrolase (beta-lactamase superfamily II)
MPPGTPYNSFVQPYPIRVDEFSEKRDGSLTVPALHLLTHTHSDHIIGLNAKSFSAKVICSVDAKEMLLRHETYYARFLRDGEFLSERRRTFEHLKPSLGTNECDGPMNYDLLVSHLRNISASTSHLH